MKFLQPTYVRIAMRHVLRDPLLSAHLRSIKLHHPSSWAHSMRVGALCADLGYEEPELAYQDLLIVTRAGMLHDTGKAFVSVDVLDKPGPLDEAERLEMQGHTRLGFLALADLPDPRIRYIAATHHEFKIGPYPRDGNDRRRIKRPEPERRTPGDPQLIRLAELVAAADIFDALTSPRSYKPALPLERVEEILLAQFTGDPELIVRVMDRA